MAGGVSAGELPPLREVIARYGLGARRSLGQHFLLDGNLTRRIARAAADLGSSTVLEVGPGPGGLTRALLAEGAARVVAVEKDGRCVEALAALAAVYPGRLHIVEADAVEADTVELARRFGTGSLRIVANLPYNVATPLLVGWLGRAEHVAEMVLMFQKEVALRLAAKPDTRDYGRLSILSQWRCEVTRLFDVAADAFVPPPKVTSTVVRLVPRPAPLAPCERRDLERVTAAAFGQRRKMLRASLKSLGCDPGPLLAAAGVAPEARAETLTVAEFCALARALAAVQ
ncbi:MAG: 16S rRNA (adenine(1518)-N(6)/adenine(1519)-N(6))-dimethyltransferase RsmA [Alphaproteobacteria bacterium]|nr:16S rRNA (adenine(1518)-N(6)/adenine(1519)-N(6))-dimethyltransferase RsmA [Alphaproteobacteria bacterium]